MQLNDLNLKRVFVFVLMTLIVLVSVFAKLYNIQKSVYEQPDDLIEEMSFVCRFL